MGAAGVAIDKAISATRNIVTRLSYPSNRFINLVSPFKAKVSASRSNTICIQLPVAIAFSAQAAFYSISLTFF
jgi:hypothetical protein